MKDYLNNQMNEKKRKILDEKYEEENQVKIWSEENDNYFKKEKEINERVNNIFI
jgi:hypothetical protein